DDRLDVAGTEDELELVLLEGRVDGGDDPSQPGHRVPGDDEGGVVREQEGDRVTGPDAALGEARGEPLDALHEVREADPLVAVDDGEVIGARLGVPVEMAQHHEALFLRLSTYSSMRTRLWKFSGVRSSSRTVMP